jgi:hypothetical protein
MHTEKELMKFSKMVVYTLLISLPFYIHAANTPPLPKKVQKGINNNVPGLRQKKSVLSMTPTQKAPLKSAYFLKLILKICSPPNDPTLTFARKKTGNYAKITTFSLSLLALPALLFAFDFFYNNNYKKTPA